jgi:hypothetical protein
MAKDCFILSWNLQLISAYPTTVGYAILAKHFIPSLSLAPGYFKSRNHRRRFGHPTWLRGLA